MAEKQSIIPSPKPDDGKLKPPPRCVIYARTSQDGEEDPSSQSIDNQIESCRALAQKHGYDIVHEIYDNNRSGRTYPSTAPEDLIQNDDAFQEYFTLHIREAKKRTRHGLGKVFESIEHDNITIILVRDLTRLQRNYKSSYLNNYIQNQLEKHGVMVHSCEEGLQDPKQSHYHLFNAITTHTKDRDVQMRLEQSRQARAKLQNTGKLISSPRCYGFESAGKQQVRPLDDELKVVKLIYDLFRQNKSMLEIVRHLNKIKVPTKTAHELHLNIHRKNIPANKTEWIWTDHVVRGILKRICYTGYLRKESGIKIESPLFMPHAIISIKEWDAVQDKLKSRSVPTNISTLAKGTMGGRLGRLIKFDHPLRGLVYCGICKRHLYSFKSTTPYRGGAITVHYYRCKNGSDFMPGKQKCRKVLIRERNPKETLELVKKQAGLGLVECLTPLTLTAFINQRVTREQDGGIDVEREKIETEQRELKRKERMFADQYSKDEIKKATWINVSEQISEERERLQQRLDEINAMANELRQIVLPTTIITDPSELTADVLRQLFLATLTRIEVFPDNIQVTLRSGGTFPIERIKMRNARVLPFYTLTWASKKQMSVLFEDANTITDDDVEAVADDKEQPILRPSESITSDTRIDVVYKYKSSYAPQSAADNEIEPIFADKSIMVFRKGRN